MPPLPIISGRQCVQALHGVGYETVRQRGSHVRLHAAERRPVTVPLHSELDRGTLRSIIRTAGLSVEEFLDLVQ